jgi:hypothetical protein
MNSVKTVERNFENDSRGKGIVHQINDMCRITIRFRALAFSPLNGPRRLLHRGGFLTVWALKIPRWKKSMQFPMTALGKFTLAREVA